MSNRPIPGPGCWVATDSKPNILGIVIDRRVRNDEMEIQVRWGQSGETNWHLLSDLRNGFRRGHIIQDKPRSNIRKTLGTATVRSHRQIAGRDMVLVQLHRTGESRWLPYETLVRIKDAPLKFQRMETENDGAQRFRLKTLAYALDSWNQVTGALDRMDVDPLPHQIDLVHRIMESDHANWLIADDVGLGKTIEVGLLLAALRRRRQARRVLIVCPAGIARQWQDEMRHKFNQDFLIYGHDFLINQPSHWATYDRVIVSIDRAKSDYHSPIFNDSGEWDVIVFDEAHHLSKMPNQAVTQRYRLAETLRNHTDRLIFLTGTPHQGQDTQFANLLMLLRPDLRSRFAKIYSDPSVVAEVILRNRKSLVTDSSGNFIFRGQDTRLVEVPISDEAREFNSDLKRYLTEGYEASQLGGNQGRAIGFVMTTYRKLASSSVAAIERALRRRKSRLMGEALEISSPTPELDELTEEFQEGTDVRDNLEEVADQIAVQNAGANPFFVDELEKLDRLIEDATKVKRNDLKLNEFLSTIVSPLQRRRPKLLIFTEYRATQEYLVNALQQRYPRAGVVQIHGSMTLDEKRTSIDKFNESARFMVSTESGGEGINLHHNCHIMVNYDLPWNPSRLVQRSGRLYRYGQSERVVVFNLTSNDDFDNQALGMMLARIDTIASTMAEVGEDYHEGLHQEILGELLERVDIASILSANRAMDISHTDSEINDAISKAREAQSQQRQLFAHVEGYDPNEAPALRGLSDNDTLAFLEGMLPYMGIKILGRQHNGRTLEIELPENLRGQYSEFPPRSAHARITVDREVAARLSDVAPMDFASPFFQYLIEKAQSPDFGGEYACLPAPQSGVLALYKIRWQDDQGMPRWDALIPIFLVERGPPTANPEFFNSLLSASGALPIPKDEPDHRKKRLEGLNPKGARRACGTLLSFETPKRRCSSGSGRPQSQALNYNPQETPMPPPRLHPRPRPGNHRHNRHAHRLHRDAPLDGQPRNPADLPPTRLGRTRPDRTLRVLPPHYRRPA